MGMIVVFLILLLLLFLDCIFGTQARFDPSLIGVKNRRKYIDFYTDLRGGSGMTSTKRCKKSYSLCSIFVSLRINHPWSRKHVSGPVYAKTF
jgi:hypothetical protein